MIYNYNYKLKKIIILKYYFITIYYIVCFQI